ncbi:MAG: hypothetical protein GC179_16260 [Anaerolineaceae bacterium]|nr:hypothetical protein [Anaerolineaceae bacterium]
MMTLEEELIEKITQLDEIQQRRVLEFIETLQDENSAERHYTAKDLMRLSPEERDRVAREALERSLGSYFDES